MILKIIADFIAPKYARPEMVAYITERTQPAKRPAERVVKEDKEVFVARNAEGQVVTTRRFEWQGDGKTDFAPVIAQVKGRALSNKVVYDLTDADWQGLQKRRPCPSLKTAAVLKKAFADRGGAITGKELALVTGFSVAYGNNAVAAFREAISE